jgi:DNA excision repair protein ERCC-3
MGRILRAKRRNEAGFRSRFYTLVSRDTDEVAFSHKRKRFLIDQGYEFKVVHDLGSLISKEEIGKLKYSGEKEREALLRAVLKESDDKGEDEVLNTALDDIAGAWQSQGKKKKSGEEIKRADKKREKARGDNPLFKTWLKK